MNTEIKSLLKDFITANGITKGITKEQHCGILVNVICETVFTDFTVDAGADPESEEVKLIRKTRADLFKLFFQHYEFTNCSYLRQTCEKENLLAKTEGGKRGGVDEAAVLALASKYA